MRVDEGDDAALSKSSNDCIDVVKVGIVVDTLRGLNCLPHDSKSDKIKTPVSKVVHIFFGQRGIRVERRICGRIRRKFWDDVHSMKQNVPSLSIIEFSILDVDSV